MMELTPPIFIAENPPIQCQGSEYPRWLFQSCNKKLKGFMNGTTRKYPAQARCNNLEVKPCPEEIACLTEYERQYICTARKFQTIATIRNSRQKQAK